MAFANEMRPTDARGAASEVEIHWDEAADFVRRRLRLVLRAAPADTIDDLVQESLVRLLRVVRREPVENVEALMTEIARRTAVDWLRRRTRWNALIDPASPPGDLADRVAAPVEGGDPLERLRFVVVEFFAVGESGCRELAVAHARGRSHDAVRKQWSRCLRLLREAAREERSPLMEWMDQGDMT